MIRSALVLATFCLLSVPTAFAAEPELVREARGCANAIVNGGTYSGNIVQCRGPDNQLVTEVVACVDAQLYGGSFYGQYIACSGIGIIPLVTGNPLVQDVVGCAKALAGPGQYYGYYLRCA